MYNSYRTSLPPYPGPLHPTAPQQQQSHYYPTPYHHLHSAPPPQTAQHLYRYYIPTSHQQIIPLHQQYNRQQRHSFNHGYQQRSLNRNGSIDQYQAVRSRSLSETRRRGSSYGTQNNVTLAANKKDDTPKTIISNTIVQEKKKPSINVLHSMKSAADWIAKTFCFCFTDDSINVIEFNDTYTTQQQQQLRKIS